MSYKKEIIVGGAAVLASDLGQGFVPAVVNFGGLPVAKWGLAIAGAYLGEKMAGGNASLMHAAILGITALGGAELKDAFVPSLSFAVGPIDIARPLAGAAAVALASKFGVEKSA